MLTQRTEIQLSYVFITNTKHWMNFIWDKKFVSIYGKKWHILDKYMQFHGQQPNFKDLKICLWELFRKQAVNSIVYNAKFCHSCKQRKLLVRKSNIEQRKKRHSHHKAANNLHYLQCGIWKTWTVLGEFNLQRGSESYLSISNNSTQSSKT